MNTGEKERLIYKIDDILKSKVTGEYLSHTFADSLSITEKTYRRAIKRKKVNYYLPGATSISHEIIQVYISNDGKMSISTYNYYLPVSELSVQELQTIYDKMMEECFEQESS